MVRYFFLSLNILNGLLALAVAAVVNYAVIPLWDPVARISLPPVKETAAPSEERKASSQHFPVADYAVISEKNLFHPERRPPLEKQPEKAVAKPDVFLYGTLITDGASIAFIEDKKTPYSTPGRGKRQTTLKKGDTLSGYTLSEIAANRIVFVKGEDKVVVMLDDREKKRTSEASAAPATSRTTAGGIAPPPPAAPPAPRAAAGGITPHQPTAPSPPQAGPTSAPAAGSPGPGIAGLPPRPFPPSSAASPPQMLPPSAPEAPSRPGIGASGAWPQTRSTVEQTRQKLRDAQQIRTDQLPRSR